MLQGLHSNYLSVEIWGKGTFLHGSMFPTMLDWSVSVVISHLIKYRDGQMLHPNNSES